MKFRIKEVNKIIILLSWLECGSKKPLTCLVQKNSHESITLHQSQTDKKKKD